MRSRCLDTASCWPVCRCSAPDWVDLPRDPSTLTSRSRTSPAVRRQQAPSGTPEAPRHDDTIVDNRLRPRHPFSEGLVLEKLGTRIDMHIPTLAAHLMTLTFKSLTSGSVQAERLPCLPSSLSIAHAVFLSEHGHTDTHKRKVTQLISL